ncbi:MAG: SIR2 family NAD-dependent protein deacylase [Actinomycetes bacterium]
MSSALDSARTLIGGAGRIAVLTGAGISTDSGIPDFRGPNGVWTKNPAAEKLATLSDYLADADVRRRAWRSRREHPAWSAQPNAGHRALVELEHSGRLVALVTQNIDGLHQQAGSSDDKVIEIHGTMHEVECLSCARRTRMSDELARVDVGEEDPPCEVCGGILKSATISFGQALVPQVVAAAIEAAESCDVFLAVGTSLTVHPAAGLCDVALDAGADLVIVNAQPTPYDVAAAVVLRDSISDVLPALVSAVAPA